MSGYQTGFGLEHRLLPSEMKEKREYMKGLLETLEHPDVPEDYKDKIMKEVLERAFQPLFTESLNVYGIYFLSQLPYTQINRLAKFLEEKHIKTLVKRVSSPGGWEDDISRYGLDLLKKLLPTDKGPSIIREALRWYRLPISRVGEHRLDDLLAAASGTHHFRVLTEEMTEKDLAKLVGKAFHKDAGLGLAFQLEEYRELVPYIRRFARKVIGNLMQHPDSTPEIRQKLFRTLVNNILIHSIDYTAGVVRFVNRLPENFFKEFIAALRPEDVKGLAKKAF